MCPSGHSSITRVEREQGKEVDSGPQIMFSSPSHIWGLFLAWLVPGHNKASLTCLSRWHSAKTLPAKAGGVGDPGLIPGLGRCLGEGNGNPLQCSCLENPMDRGDWRDTVPGVAKKGT